MLVAAISPQSEGEGREPSPEDETATKQSRAARRRKAGEKGGASGRGKRGGTPRPPRPPTQSDGGGERSRPKRAPEGAPKTGQGRGRRTPGGRAEDDQGAGGRAERPGGEPPGRGDGPRGSEATEWGHEPRPQPHHTGRREPHRTAKGRREPH